MLFVWKFFVRPKRVIPAAASNPFAFFVLGNGVGDALLEFLDGGNAVQLDGEHAGSRAAEVHVRVVEARHQEFAFELNGFGG